jgi:hypothetical protein
MSVSRIKIEFTRAEEGCLGCGRATWSTSKLTEASGVLIELADVGFLPEEYEDQVRLFGYDLVRIAS